MESAEVSSPLAVRHSCFAGNRSWLYSASPVKNKICTIYWCNAIVWKNWKFLAERWVWAWWPFASVVLPVHFPIMWLGNEWEPAPPPPPSMDLSSLFNPHFLGLTLRHRNTVTWTCDWHVWFSLIYIFINIDTTTFCNSKLASFFSTVGLFLWRAAFCPSGASV